MPAHGIPGLPSGAERNRTADLQIAILALSQLSYCPKTIVERLGWTGTKGPGGTMQDTAPSFQGRVSPEFNGEGGIRTHGPHGEHTLSRRADSTALAPLPGL